MYQGTIAKELARMGRTSIDPRHIEGFMRLEFGTLDHLCIERFREEVRIGVECVDVGGREEAERLAMSYGL